MIRFIYCCPLPIVVIIVFLLIVMWSIMGMVVCIEMQYKSIYKCLNFTLLCGIIIIVLYLTIFSRNTGEHEVCLVPFYSFVVAQEQPEMYRSMFMNVLLFVPFGLSLPYVLKVTCRRKIRATVLTAFWFSFCIEVLQYIFMFGRAEVDDVICNTLGAFIGSLSFALYGMLEKKNKD